jgi:hypothetical protein
MHQTRMVIICSRCGVEVDALYEVDASVGYAGWQDTDHCTSDGTDCDLSDEDTSAAEAAYSPDVEEA